MRRFLRTLGGILLGLGVLALVYAFVIWRWNDPATSLYTRWQQNKLEDRYRSAVQAYEPPLPLAGATLSPAERRRATAEAARRYRLDTQSGQAIGRIRVPRLGVDMILVDGTDTDSLRKGPGRDLRTFMPGEGQLVYIAGHRTTFLAPFAHIDRLARGDRVTLELPYGTFVYRVTGHRIVPANDIARLRSPGHEVVALQACHPRFSARQRYIVYALPLSRTPPPPTNAAALSATS